MSASKHGVELVKHVGKAASKPVNTNWQVGKFKHQLPCIHEQAGPIERHLRKIDYTLSHYPRLGLLKDDLGYEKKSVMKEARNRMTEDQRQARIYRCLRANFLQSRKDLLAEEQWTPMDAEHCYLTDIVNQIERENHERNLIKCATNDFDDIIDKLSLQYFKYRNIIEVMQMRKKLDENLMRRKLC